MSNCFVVTKGDDLGAFGGALCRINLVNPENYVISKAIFVCGVIKKEFVAPVFPLKVSFDSAETKKLMSMNVAQLVVYDEDGRQKTCEGALKFRAKNGVL